jgi:glycosyltransferase involved in cell wall biosynthesis
MIAPKTRKRRWGGHLEFRPISERRMRRKYRALFITIVPSPYQRDLFGALAAHEDVELSVYYMESQSPDSPWPRSELRPFERIMPGFWVPFGSARGHINWGLPDISKADFVVLSSLTSMTGQWLMRRRLAGQRWIFWGERLRNHTGWKGMIQRRLAGPVAQASGVVGIGREAEEDYRRRFPQLPHFCIPYYCGLAEFLAIPRPRAAGTPMTILFCGQMIHRKGIDLLLTAFERLIAKKLDVQLLLVGREAELNQFLARLGPAARSRIRYAGFQPPERLPQYFAQSDVFVLPSRYDGWGVVINQALAAGLPVVSSDAAGAGLDLVEQGENGITVSAGDVDELQRALEFLLEHPEVARRWGNNSRKKAFEITPEAGAAKWVQVFDALHVNPKLESDIDPVAIPVLQ